MFRPKIPAMFLQSLFITEEMIARPAKTFLNLSAAAIHLQVSIITDSLLRWDVEQASQIAFRQDFFLFIGRILDPILQGRPISHSGNQLVARPDRPDPGGRPRQDQIPR